MRRMALHHHHLGRMGYAAALAVQRERNLAVSRDEAEEIIFTVEHDPVITLSQRPTVRDHLLASDAELQRLGIDVQATDRGGDITYHGPGQLVCYPILRLDRHGLNLSRYMRLLEAVVIDTVAAFGVHGLTEAGATGVWVVAEGSGIGDQGSGKAGSETSPTPPPDPRSPIPEPRRAKLAALGVRIRKHTTLHGLALNVTTNLSHFATIDPCGLGGRPVTSLHALLGERCPSIDTVRDTLVERLRTAVQAGRPAPEMKAHRAADRS